jgi:hypothetical protein
LCAKALPALALMIVQQAVILAFGAAVFGLRVPAPGLLAELPGWARAAAPASPGYWAMTAMRSALQDQAAGTLRAAAVLVAIGVAAGVAATWRISRGWPRPRLL